MAVDLVAEPLPEVAPPKAWNYSVRLCRSWLHYQTPSLAGMQLGPDTLTIIGEYVVPSSRYDRDGGGAMDESAPKGYRPALVAAQLHWTATLLPPMLRDVAEAARTERYTGVIIGMLAVRHRSEWLRWRYAHPLHPLKALLSHTAVVMASMIMEEGWP